MGYYGTRIFIELAQDGRIHGADHLFDGIVLLDNYSQLERTEILRALNPGGHALIKNERITKPRQKNVDDWSHHYHGPDNNPRSLDRIAKAPYRTQFMAEPYFAPTPQIVVSANGINFMAFGHIAWHKREEPWLNTLVAVNAYNGNIKWTKKITEGLMIDRSIMVASKNDLFFADYDGCLVIDPQTGETKRKITLPLANGQTAMWKWLAVEDGVLYALLGETEKREKTKAWQQRGPHWSWNHISGFYNKNDHVWSQGQRMIAMDISDNDAELKWTFDSEQVIDARGIAMSGDRIFISALKKHLSCLHKNSGEIQWQRDADVYADLGTFQTTNSPNNGWKSSVYIRCDESAVYLIGSHFPYFKSIDAASGRDNWLHKSPVFQIIIDDQYVYAVGAERSYKSEIIDKETGAVVKDIAISKHSCTRVTATPDALMFRNAGGSSRIDLNDGSVKYTSQMRPACMIGTIVANGLFYWTPWACDCNLSLTGSIACAPANDFVFNQAADASRLTVYPHTVSESFREHVCDWKTHRADNKRSNTTLASMTATLQADWNLSLGDVQLCAPVTAGNRIFVAADDGIVRCLDNQSGEEYWRAYVGGSVKIAPSIAHKRVYVPSGDGRVYCLDAATGHCLWTFRAAPEERKINVYGKLMSTWPIGSGICVDGETIYFAAGINSFDGTHVYALDALTGAIKWQNNNSGHLNESKQGVSVAGEMWLKDGRVFMAGGTKVSPAIFDCVDGKCQNTLKNKYGSHKRRGRELFINKRGHVEVDGSTLYAHNKHRILSGDTDFQKQVIKTPAYNIYVEQIEHKHYLIARREQVELWRQPLMSEPVPWGVAVDMSGRVIVAGSNGMLQTFAPVYESNPTDDVLVAYALEQQNARALDKGLDLTVWQQFKSLDSAELHLNNANKADASVRVSAGFTDAGLYFLYDISDDSWPLNKRKIGRDAIDIFTDYHSVTETVHGDKHVYYQMYWALSLTRTQRQLVIPVDEHNMLTHFGSHIFDNDWDKIIFGNKKIADTSCRFMQKRIAEDRLLMQWFIPWSYYGNIRETAPYIGESYALCIGYNDADDGQKQHDKLRWPYGIDPYCREKDPKTDMPLQAWGNLVFAPKPGKAAANKN